jgi:MoaA/NifB/PqqE/SkfB family radical SAM enzyme
MSWEVAQASLDLFLQNQADSPLIEFSGGEPLLEPELLERCITYARDRAGGRRVRFILTTNGILLTPALVDMLVSHDVDLQMSFDGVQAAQDRRGTRTQAHLRETLAVIRRDHPPYFTDHLRIHACLMPSTVQTLARSCRFFIDLGVPDVRFYPVIGQEDEHSRDAFEPLGAQMDEVVMESARHWERKGTVPVSFLRGERGAPRNPPNGLCCAAGTTSGLCVDTAGRAWSCPLFAKSLQPIPAMAREASDILDLGDVRDPDFLGRLEALPAKAAKVPLLTQREDKYSKYGACRDCELLGECPHCPASTAHLPGNADPHRMDDFACAFIRAASRARKAFHQKTGGAALAAQTEDLRLALARLADALQRDTQSEPRH